MLRLLKFSKEEAPTGQPTNSSVRVIWWLPEGNHRDLMQSVVTEQLDVTRTAPILLNHDSIRAPNSKPQPIGAAIKCN